jgi:hypothetical protein
VDDNIPEARTVIEFAMTGTGGGQAWLVLDKGSSTACQIDPGYDADIVVHGDNREFHRWLLGTGSYRELRKKGALRIVGPSRLARAFPTWFETALFQEGLAARPHPKRGPVVLA